MDMNTKTPEQIEQDEFASAFGSDGGGTVETGDGVSSVVNPTNDSAQNAATEKPAPAPAVKEAAASGDTPVSQQPEDKGFDAAKSAPSGSVSGNPPEGSGTDDAPGGLDNTPESPSEEAGKTMTEQQLRSWEGRIKARERELSAGGKLESKSEPVVESSDEEQGEPKIDKAIEAAAEVASTPAEEASVEKIASDVKSGKMSAEEAVAALKADFGEEFVDMLDAMVSDRVAKATGPIESGFKELIDSVDSNNQRSHYETIHDANPDFIEIVNDPKFNEFAKTQQSVGGTNITGEEVLAKGTARQVNALIKSYKDSIKGTEPTASAPVQPASSKPVQDESKISAAEGVRSAVGISLPADPEKQSFEKAWAES